MILNEQANPSQRNLQGSSTETFETAWENGRPPPSSSFFNIGSNQFGVPKGPQVICFSLLNKTFF